MSIKLMAQVFDTSFEPRERLVMLVLANFASDDGRNVFPSVPTVARMTGLSESSVQRSIKKMMSKGWLEQAGYIRITNGKINCYRIIADNFPTGSKVTPVAHSYPSGSKVTPDGYQGDTQSVRGNVRETVVEKPAIVATIPPTADVANSVTMEAPAHLRTMPAPNHKRPKWMGVQERDSRLTTYEALTGWKLNKLQEDDIKARVTPDDPTWESCIRQRMSFGCSIRRVSDAIDDYLAGGPVDFKAQRGQQSTSTPQQPPAIYEWVTTPKGKVLRYEGTPYPGDAGRQKCEELGIAYEGN